MKTKNWILMGAGASLLMLFFRAEAAESPVVENFFMAEAVSYNPVMVCPKGSRPLKGSEGCKGSNQSTQDQDFKPTRVSEYLQKNCPGAILRSLTPAPYTDAARYGDFFRTVQGNFAIGFEPPIGGCSHAEQADAKDPGQTEAPPVSHPDD